MAGLEVQLSRAVARVRAHCAKTPTVGVVLGSGLGSFADSLSDPSLLNYAEIPHMPVSGVPGHRGSLMVGDMADATVACLSGRSHLYEGYSAGEVVFPVRLLAHLGCEVVLITNAAGGIDDQLVVGDLMLIEDHLNLTGHNPLLGSAGKSRFVDLTQAYDDELMVLAEQAAGSCGLKLKRGVYAGVLGPSYETPAEIRMLRTLGACAVGMSTVLEAIALRQLGVKIAGLSAITNLAAGLGGGRLDHSEVGRVGQSIAQRLNDLLRTWIGRIVASRPEKPGAFGPSD